MSASNSTSLALTKAPVIVSKRMALRIARTAIRRAGDGQEKAPYQKLIGAINNGLPALAELVAGQVKLLSKYGVK